MGLQLLPWPEAVRPDCNVFRGSPACKAAVMGLSDMPPPAMEWLWHYNLALGPSASAKHENDIPTSPERLHATVSGSRAMPDMSGPASTKGSKSWRLVVLRARRSSLQILQQLQLGQHCLLVRLQL